MGARRKVEKSPAQVEARTARVGRLLGVALLLGLLLGTAGGVTWWLGQPDTLPIRRVQVEGEFRYLKQEALHAAIGELASGGFFNVDLRAVKQAAETQPWVASASVRRQWPDTLRIEIREQVPLARWGDNRLVSAAGVVFAPENSIRFDNLPRFSGPDAAADQMAVRYQQLAGEMARAGLAVTDLVLSDRRAWELRLANGLRLLLGRVINDVQLRHFVTVYPRALADKAPLMESVDLRYSNGFAVRWKAAAAGKPQ
jgi:cell division protein FtsQ